MRTNRSTPVAAQAEARTRQRSLLEFLARNYSQALTRYFVRRVRDKSDIADLVQDVFLRLARLKDLSAIEKPEQYLFTTAASALRDRHRRDAVRERESHDSFEETRHGCTDFSAERVFTSSQAVECLQRAIRELPERTRDVFVLRVFEASKMGEIAGALGISQRAVEKHYAKGLAYVTARMKDYRDE